MAFQTYQSFRLLLQLVVGCGLFAALVAGGVNHYGAVGESVSAPWSGLQNWPSLMPPLSAGMVAALTALLSGGMVARFWARSVGLMTFSAGRIAEGDYSVEFGEFSKIPEVRGLSEALQKLLTVREQQGSDLRETLRHFHGTFENAAVGVFHVGRTGTFQRVNRRFCEIVGYPREDLLRRNLQEILHPEDSLVVGSRIHMLFEGKTECFSIEKRCFHRSGIPVWVQFTATVMRNEQGEPEYAIAFVEDVSARRNAEEKLIRSEASLRSLIDCNRDSCVAVLDLDGCVLSVNPIGMELLRVVSGEASAGLPWAALWEVSEKGSVETAMLEAKCGGVGRFRGHRSCTAVGTTWWEVTTTAIPGPEGRPERLISVARDVTVQHVAADALQQAKESAEAASRAKDDLLSALSHELRTPLNPVLLLAGEYARSPDLPARMREDFRLIHRNVRLEARLIDDLLDLTKIQRAGLSLSTRLLDLCALVSQVCEGARAESAEKDVSLRFERPDCKYFVRGDSTRLHQIFANLIVNAVKFSGAGGEVTLCMTQEGGNVRVSVRDAGIGITTEELGRIFEPFAQGTHAREPQRFGGLGLGLAIARMLVERHRGRIWAESGGRGCGATFYVELPTEQHDPAVTAPLLLPADLRTREVRSRRILLVEDHEATRTTLSRMLKRRGHSVTQAATYQSAVACAKEGTFDVLISDIGLPDGNGGDLIRDFGDRFSEGGIALSGFGMEAEVARSLQSGFRKHLTKPIEIETLEETLNAMDASGVQGLLAI